MTSRPSAATREIWLGPLLGKQRALLIERCAERLRQGRGEEILYIAASRPLMLEVYDRMVDGKSIRGNVGALPIHLFTGLIGQILRSARILVDGREEPLPRRDRIDLDTRPLQRPLLSQVMAQLALAGRIPHFGHLAKSDGCVESVGDLIGEIQRAGKSALDFHKIVDDRIRRAMESLPRPDASSLRNGLPSEIDDLFGYERDVSLIYESYQAALRRGGLTEINEDHLRVLQVLDGDYEGYPCVVPYLKPVTLMIVDGFFDFTPAQGEILKRLIVRAPEVVFNFDYDLSNRDVFRPIDDTMEHVEKMADNFTRVFFHDADPTVNQIAVAGTPPEFAPIRRGLFNTLWRTPESDDPPAPPSAVPAFIIESPDKEREIRAVAREIKNLVLLDEYQPFEIAVVVREKTSYGSEIRRIFSEEGIAYSLDERLKVADIPAVRAVRKLLDTAVSRRPEDKTGGLPRFPVGKLVDLLKSDYFHLPGVASVSAEDGVTPEFSAGLQVDEIENVVAFVGGQLHLDDWLGRAARLLGKPEDVVTGVSALSSQPGLPFEELLVQEEFLDETRELGTEFAKHGHIRPDAVSPEQIFVASRVLSALGQLLLEIPFDAPVEETARAFESVLKRLRFEDQLERVVKAVQGDPEKTLRATLDLRGLQAVRRAVAAVEDAVRCASSGIAARDREFGTGTEDATVVQSKTGPNIRVTAFRDELGRALENLPLRVQPETFGSVRILEATDVRGLTFRAIFVLGLVEGGFPMRGRADWIYPPAERERLKEYGLTLEDISPAVMRKEEHYFYQIVCRATERLYLACAKADDEETETVASYFLTEFKRLFPDETFSEDLVTLLKISKGYDGAHVREATTAREFARGAMAVRRRIKQGEPPEAFLRPEGVLSPGEVAEFLHRQAMEGGYVAVSARPRLRMEEARDGRTFTAFDGRLESTVVRSATERQFGANRVFSATEFNQYGQCPFRFFAQRVLHLKPRVEAALDLQNQDRGLLLHEILREFFDRERGTLLAGRNRERLLAALKGAADGVFDRFEKRLPPLNPQLWKIERAVVFLQLEQVLDYEIETERETARPLRPRHGELAFGMRGPHQDPASVKEPLVLRNEVGDMLRLRGQIDRVDASTDGKLLAYDYKTSRGSSLIDMRAGRDVQLAIYLEALEQLFRRAGEEVVGGGYYVLRGGGERRNNGLYRSEFAPYTGIGKTVSNLSEEDWTEVRRQLIGHVWDYWRRMRDGDFRVKPAQNEQTCQYCDYKAVCRFDRYRIRRKR